MVLASFSTRPMGLNASSTVRWVPAKTECVLLPAPFVGMGVVILTRIVRLVLRIVLRVPSLPVLMPVVRASGVLGVG